MAIWDVSTQTEWEDATETHDDTQIDSDQLKLAEAHALDFDGTDDYVETTTLGDFGSSMDTDFTVSIWTNSTDTSDSVSYLSTHVSGETAFHFRRNWGDGDEFELYLRDEGGDRLELKTDGPYGADGEWHNIVVRKTGNSSTDLSLWMDGEEITNTYFNKNENFSNPADFTNELLIGARGGDYDRHIDAQLDDVRIYDKALSSSEISDLASDRYHDVATSDLRAWWKMNEGSGSTVYDSSGNDYDGTIEGATWTDISPDTGLWTSDIWDDGYTDKSTFKSFSTSVATLPTGSSAYVQLVVYDSDGSTQLDSSAWYILSEGSNDINFYVDNGNYWQLKYDLRANDTNSTPEIDSYSLESVRLPLTGNVKLSDSNIEGVDVYCIKKNTSEYEDSDTTDSNGDYEVLVSEDDTVYVVSVVYYDSSEDKYYGMSKTIDYSS